MHDVSHEVFSQNRVVTFSDGFHHVLVELILFGDVEGLLELFVLTVEQSSNSSALKEVVAFKTNSQLEGFKGIILLDGSSEGFEVFVLNVDFVKGLVHSTDVLGLHGLKEGSNEVNVSCVPHDLDCLGEIDFG